MEKRNDLSVKDIEIKDTDCGEQDSKRIKYLEKDFFLRWKGMQRDYILKGGKLLLTYDL